MFLIRFPRDSYVFPVQGSRLPTVHSQLWGLQICVGLCDSPCLVFQLWCHIWHLWTMTHEDGEGGNRCPLYCVLLLWHPGQSPPLPVSSLHSQPNPHHWLQPMYQAVLSPEISITPMGPSFQCPASSACRNGALSWAHLKPCQQTGGRFLWGWSCSITPHKIWPPTGYKG